MTIPLIGTYIAPYKPLNNITPFNYRDGATYLEVLEGLRQYVNDTLVTFVNENFTELGDEFVKAVNEILSQVDANTIAIQNFVNAAVDSIINSSVDVAESTILLIIENPESAVSIILDAKYGAKTDVDTLNTLVTTGRLSETELDSSYGDKATVDALNSLATSGRLSETELTNDFAAKSVEADVSALETLTGTGRLSESALDAAYSPLSGSGTYAARPAANAVPIGYIYYATNVPEVYRSNGTLWQVIGSGGNELGYAIAGAGHTTTSDVWVDIPGGAVTFVAGERPVEFRINGDVANGLAGGITLIGVLYDSNEILVAQHRDIDGSRWHTVSSTARLATIPPGTTHTAKLVIKSSTTGTAVANTFTLSVKTV